MHVAKEITATELRRNLGAILDRVWRRNATVIVRRRSGKNIAIIRADKLVGLMSCIGK